MSDPINDFYDRKRKEANEAWVMIGMAKEAIYRSNDPEQLRYNAKLLIGYCRDLELAQDTGD